MSQDTPPPTDSSQTQTPDTQNVASLRIAQWTQGDPASLEARESRRLLVVGRVLAIALTVTLLGLLGRVVQLQAMPSEPIAKMRNQQTSTAVLPAMRGALTDRSGRVFAATRIAHRMYCDPMFIENRTTFIETIAYELGYSPEEMIAMEIKMSGRSGGNSRYVLLDRRMTDEQVDRFHEAKIAGIYLEPVVVRDYPQGGIAGTLLGFVGNEGDGLEGLERHWESRLAATPGQYKYLRDSRRRALWLESESYVPYEDGENVRLSIDAVIQGIAERELAKAIATHMTDCKPGDHEYVELTGQLIVMQPHTGEILAIATYPSYDPSDYQAVEDAQRRNRPITDVFEPGSIFKPFIWAGLLEMGAVRGPDEMVDTSPDGFWVMPNGRTLRDASGHGRCSWHEVLVFSSNIGMAKIALRRDIHDIFDIMHSFGFGQRTGVDLPGEVVGLLRMKEGQGAQSYSHGSWPMGQEVSVTGIQLVRAMSVLANGGIMITPRIEAINPYNQAEQSVVPQRVVSQRTARSTMNAMRAAVANDHGTGRRANSPYYDIFGKTGTAQLPSPTGYMDDGFASSFLGGAPADSPRIVVGCFIIGTKRATGHYGGLVSAPAVRSVIEQSLVYLGVPTNPGTDPTEITLENESSEIE